MLKVSPDLVFDSGASVEKVISDSEFDWLCEFEATFGWKAEFDKTDEYLAEETENDKSKDSWPIFDNFVASSSPVLSLVATDPKGFSWEVSSRL